MKTYGNLILMTVICIVIFWVFMALRPTHAADDESFYLGTCIVKEVPEGENNCLIFETDNNFEACTVMRKLAIEQKLMVSQCRRSKEAVKAELNKLWNSKS